MLIIAKPFCTVVWYRWYNYTAKEYKPIACLPISGFHLVGNLLRNYQETPQQHRAGFESANHDGTTSSGYRAHAVGAVMFLTLSYDAVALAGEAIDQFALGIVQLHLHCHLTDRMG